MQSSQVIGGFMAFLSLLRSPKGRCLVYTAGCVGWEVHYAADLFNAFCVQSTGVGRQDLHMG